MLAEGRRARQARTLRWVVLTIALVAAAAAALYTVWQGTLNEERRAVPNPLQTPTAEPVPTPTESPSASPSVTPDPAPEPTGTADPPASPPPAGGEAALIDFGFRDGAGKVSVQADAGGVRFTGLDAAAGEPAVLPGPTGDRATVRAGVPAPGWTLAVLPKGATWATIVQPILEYVIPSQAQLVAVPGTDWVAAAFVSDEPEADPRLVWARGDALFTGAGDPVESVTFPSLDGVEATLWNVDAWDISGWRTPTGYETVQEGGDGLLPAGSMAGQDGASVAFAVLLPAGADPASLSWDFGRPATTAAPRTTQSLPDGRTWVHEGFRAQDITDWGRDGPIVTWTAADGSTHSSRVIRP